MWLRLQHLVVKQRCEELGSKYNIYLKTTSFCAAAAKNVYFIGGECFTQLQVKLVFKLICKGC